MSRFCPGKGREAAEGVGGGGGGGGGGRGGAHTAARATWAVSGVSVAMGAVTLCGLLVEADANGLAQTVAPLRAGGGLSPA